MSCNKYQIEFAYTGNVFKESVRFMLSSRHLKRKLQYFCQHLDDRPGHDATSSAVYGAAQ